MKKFFNLLEVYFAGGCTVFAIENFLTNNWLMATLESLTLIAVAISIAINIKKGDL